MFLLDCSDMEELESHNDLVLHLDIKNSAFETDFSISQTFNQFISNVLTSMNGQPLTNRREVTAIFDVKENGIFYFKYRIIILDIIFGNIYIYLSLVKYSLFKHSNSDSLIQFSTEISVFNKGIRHKRKGR